VHRLVSLDEVESGQRQDAIAVEGGLEGEVEAGERLHGRDPGRHQRHLHPPVLAQRQLLGQEQVDGVERRDLASLDLAHGLVQHLERPGHLEPDQVAADAIEGLGRGHSGDGHGRPPPSARCRPAAA